MKKALKIMKWSVLTILVVLIATVGYGTWFITSMSVEKAEGIIKSNSGFTVDISDDTTIALFPNPKVFVPSVKVESFRGNTPLFTADNISVEISLQELFRLGLGLKHFSMENPKVYMRVDAKGNPSWEPKRKRSRHSGGAPSGLGPIVSIGDIEISGGELIYEDDSAGQQYHVKDVEVNIGGKQLDNTDAGFAANINGVPVWANIQTKLDNFRSVPLRSSIKIGKNEIKLDGVIAHLFSKNSYQGKLDVNAPELMADALQILRLPPDLVPMLIPFEFSSDVDYGHDKVTLGDIQTEFGNRGTAKMTGSLSYEMPDREGLSKIEADLKTGEQFDLSVFGLCRPTVEGDEKVERPSDEIWSTQAMDSSFLASHLLNVNLKINKLTCDKLIIDQVVVDAENKENLLNVKSLNIISGEGNVYVGLKQKYGPTLMKNGELNLRLNKFPIETFMPPERATVVDLPLSGSGNLTYQGTSVAEWINSLAGNLAFVSPAMDLNVPLDNLAFAIESIFSKKVKAGQKDTVVALDSVFNIENGIVRTEKMILANPNITLEGDGKIDLNRMKISYRVVPVGKNKLGVNLPVKIQGNLSNPRVFPDVASPQGIGAGVGAVVGGPVGASVGAMIGSMVDGSGRKVSETEVQKEGEGVEKNVKKIFNIFGGGR